ncbi:MAG: hypothetical protein LBT43_07385 [Prevotella sp.]|jgi:hypothetical protein|nr:hypothetical protein [Prevotella sp.]
MKSFIKDLNMFDISKYKTEINIDKINHPDTEIIDYHGNMMQLGDIRKLYEQFEEKRYNMISFYDDIFQYTSLGLLDLIFDLHNINSPIPFKSFFKRHCIYGKQFIYDIVKRFNITKEQVDDIEKNNYEEILRRSPVSHNANSYFKIREICSNQLLVMKYPFSIANTFIRFIQETYGKDEFISLELDYLGNKTEEEYLKTFPKSKISYFDIVICQDAASIIEFMVEKNIKGTEILTPFDHCGISNEAKLAFETYLGGTGPNGCKIHYVNEEVK